MGLSIHFDPETGDALGRVTGPMTLEVVRESLAALWRDPAWNGRRVLWDVRESAVELTTPEVQASAKYVLENQPDPPPERVAFVVGREADFGMARMFEAFREHPGTDHRVFRSLEEASEWIRS